MILVCGGLADPVTELVCARLTACGYPYRLLDLGAYPAGFDVHWCWQGHVADGFIASRDWHVDLASLTGVYVRYLGNEGRIPLPDIAEPVIPAIFAEYDAGLTLLFEDLPCAVVNRLRGGLSNHSKPYQALLLEQCGMRTPSTLITNDPAAVRRFYDECHGEVIYKSVSGVRSIVRRLRIRPARAPSLSAARSCAISGVHPGRRRARAHGRGSLVRHARAIDGRGLPLRTARRRRYADDANRSAGGDGRGMPAGRAIARPPVYRHRPEAHARRRVRLLRGQPFSGLPLLRTAHGPANQRRARRSAARRCVSTNVRDSPRDDLNTEGASSHGRETRIEATIRVQGRSA